MNAASTSRTSPHPSCHAPKTWALDTQHQATKQRAVSRPACPMYVVPAPTGLQRIPGFKTLPPPCRVQCGCAVCVFLRMVCTTFLSPAAGCLVLRLLEHSNTYTQQQATKRGSGALAPELPVWQLQDMKRRRLAEQHVVDQGGSTCCLDCIVWFS